MGARRTRCQRAAHSYLLAGGRARRRVNAGVVTGCGGCSAGQCVPQCVTLAPWGGLAARPRGGSGREQMSTPFFLSLFPAHTHACSTCLASLVNSFFQQPPFFRPNQICGVWWEPTHPPSLLPPPRREARGVGLGATVESRVARLLQALPPSGRLFPWLERAARAAALNPPVHTAVAVAA